MEEVGHFVGSLEHFVRDYGTAAVTVILALEALGAPLPGETLVIFASVLAGRGDMSLPALLIFAWAGSVLGRKLGRAAITRYGARVGLTASRFDAVERVFARYGAATVAFARFVSVRSTRSGPHCEWRCRCSALFFSASNIAVIAELARRFGIIAGVVTAVVLLVALVVFVQRQSSASRAPRR